MLPPSLFLVSTQLSSFQTTLAEIMHMRLEHTGVHTCTHTPQTPIRPFLCPFRSLCLSYFYSGSISTWFTAVSLRPTSVWQTAPNWKSGWGPERGLARWEWRRNSSCPMPQCQWTQSEAFSATLGARRSRGKGHHKRTWLRFPQHVSSQNIIRGKKWMKVLISFIPGWLHGQTNQMDWSVLDSMAYAQEGFLILI